MRRIRDVLRLKFEAGLSDRTLAAAVGISKGAVAAYVYRARAAGLSWRRCQVRDDGDAGSLRLVVASHGTCNSGHIPPCGECGVTSGAVFSGSHAVAAKLEVVVDPAVCG
jgi:hypothetical protein